MPTTTLPYRYAHASTESMTGYFSCEPPEALSFEDALARLEAAPLDEFFAPPSAAPHRGLAPE